MLGGDPPLAYAPTPAHQQPDSVYDQDTAALYPLAGALYDLAVKLAVSEQSKRHARLLQRRLLVLTSLLLDIAGSNADDSCRSSAGVAVPCGAASIQSTTAPSEMPSVKGSMLARATTLLAADWAYGSS